MKYIISYSSLFIAALFLMFGCSDVKDNIIQPQEINVHGQGTYNVNSQNFHGYLVEKDGFQDCQRCHAADYSGGTAGISCIQCHTDAIDVHKEGIKNPSSDNFHGKFFAANETNFDNCTSCHGSDFTGGVVSPSCVDCHGGIQVHKVGILNPGSDSFHGKFISNTINWDLAECSQCHGSDYAGGLAAPTCKNCHTEENGPEACNTCHGDFSDPTKIAPPRGTHGETSTSDAAVGAHQVHLYGIEIAQNVECSQCHKVPQNFGDAGHIDETNRAELTFGSFANQGPSSATYNFQDMKCENVYCHGNFAFDKASSSRSYAYSADQIQGNDYSPQWNKVDGTQAKCGTCHGEIDQNGQLVTPLPKGHAGDFMLTDCATCHSSVVDGSGNIISTEKHINGKINVFGE